jgi:flagellar biosynthetic protein FlhB
MAEDSATEKQHEASSKRLSELRDRGQTLRSRDLTSGMVVMVAILSLVYLGENFKMIFEDNFIISFNEIKQVMTDNDFPGTTLNKLAKDNLFVLIPFFSMLLITAFLSPFVFGGWNFTLNVIKFNAGKLSPTSNLSNIFSKRIFVELSKSLLKFALIISTLLLFASSKLGNIKLLLTVPLNTAMTASYGMTVNYIYVLCFAIIIIGSFDALYHYFDYQIRHKMTTQELKDEHKEAEGSVDVKRKIRSKQIALMKQRLHLTVPKATVIITNPTHYAIALRYDDKKDRAPKVVAKGKDLMAGQIRHLAIANGVPIYQAPVLARAIYHTSQIGSEIHPGLYMAVAIVLSYVHQLKNYQMGYGQIPNYISDLEVPKELVYDE